MVHRPVITVFLFLLLPAFAFAQGKMHRADGHYIGVLDFFNNHPEPKHRIPHPGPANNGFVGPFGGWVGDGEIEFRGLMAGAVLVVDWWLLFGEPVANYEFIWRSSGRYEIRYKVPKKDRVSVIITREALQKYPVLLKRFDALKPLETNFEIRWHIGDQSAKDREAFKRQYRLFGSIGGQAPHVKTGLTTHIHSGQILNETSGVKPFSVPSSPPGGWKTFGSLPDSFDATKIRMLSHYFRIATAQNVRDFRATGVRWPLAEMRAIALDFAALEAGNPPLSPSEQVAAATAKKLPSYAPKDEWAKAEMPPADPAPPSPVKTADGLYHYQFKNGKKAFPQAFHGASGFENGFAWVNLGRGPDGEWRQNIINLKGELQLPPTYNRVSVSDGRFATVGNAHSDQRERRFGLLDLQTGRWLLPVSYHALGVHHLTVSGGRYVSTVMYANFSEPYREHDRDNSGYNILYVDADETSEFYDLDKTNASLTKTKTSTSRRADSIKYRLGLDEQRRRNP